MERGRGGGGVEEEGTAPLGRKPSSWGSRTNEWPIWPALGVPSATAGDLPPRDLRSPRPLPSASASPSLSDNSSINSARFGISLRPASLPDPGLSPPLDIHRACPARVDASEAGGDGDGRGRRAGGGVSPEG